MEASVMNDLHPSSAPSQVHLIAQPCSAKDHQSTHNSDPFRHVKLN
jgi:hypothetical protein